VLSTANRITVNQEIYSPVSQSGREAEPKKNTTVLLLTATLQAPVILLH
jgi:hypothetical protein